MRDRLVMTLAVSAGAVDAVSWLGLGKVFSAFMTGNLVFAGLAAGGADGPSVVRVLAALLAFALGAALAARIVRTPEPDGEWPAGVTSALRVTLALQVVFLVLWAAVGGRPSAGFGDLLIAVSSVAMGVQTIAVFKLGLRAEFTTAATATLAVLAGDLAGWSASRAERLRLLTVVLGIVAGAALGALLVAHARSWAPVLPLALLGSVVAVAPTAQVTGWASQ